MHLTKLGAGEAAFRLAKKRAQEVLESNAGVLRHVQDFQHLWIQTDYCRELMDYGNLDDEVYVATCMGLSATEIRAWVLGRFRKLAST